MRNDSNFFQRIRNTGKTLPKIRITGKTLPKLDSIWVATQLGADRIILRPTKKAWFIRHAESESNAGIRTSHNATIPLTPTGQSQAKKIASEFTSPPELIVTSKYLRTKQTAEPLIKKYPNVPCEEWQIHEFSYISPVRCQNMDKEERAPIRHAYWKSADPFYRDDENVESFADFIERVKNTLGILRSRPENFTVLFSHGLFIEAVLWIIQYNIDELDAKLMTDFKKFTKSNQILNGEIVELVFERNGILLTRFKK